MPIRIQRKREKGWRMPDGAVYVGRPTHWGNPFWHTERFHGLEASLAFYRETVQGSWRPALLDRWCIANPQIPYHCHTDFLKRLGVHPMERLRAELRGRDLACWCRLDKPCHADILIQLANA